MIPPLITLQQYLPFTVLKHSVTFAIICKHVFSCNSTYRLRYWNVIILAISTISDAIFVATVPTVYGIETSIFLQQERHRIFQCCNSTYRLRYWNGVSKQLDYLEDKVSCNSTYRLRYWNLSIAKKACFQASIVATVPTVYGIETSKSSISWNWS